MTKSEQTNGHKAIKEGLNHSTIGNYAQVSRSQEATFVGRARELTAIMQYFQNPGCRLLSLIGLGGVGKTRIAWEVGARLADDFPHGVYFVPLAAISSPDLIVPAIAASIGYSLQGSDPPQIQLIKYLSWRKMLLILDNFEHLISGSTDLLTEILQAALDTRLLVTSRERINLREEWVIDIQGLDYPADEANTDNFSAVQLFVQNARRVKADFELTDASRADVIRICRLVEGMPLGIELAAVWVRALSCRAIGDEIARSLDFLTTSLRNIPEKHRSMRAVFARSYDLLTADQQQIFAKLSVFRGGFNREAAEAITGASLMTLADFMDKSLLRVNADGRYDMHELLRQYGEEQLEMSGAGDSIRDSHSAYFADFLNQRIQDMKGYRQIEALAEITADFENIRTAWYLAAINKREDTINLMLEGLWQFSVLRNREQESMALFRYAERQFAPGDGGERQRIWGCLVSRVTDDMTVASQAQLETALQIAQYDEDLAEIGHCLNRLGYAAYSNQDYDKAKQLFEQSVTCYRELGDRYYLAGALFDLVAHEYEGTRDDVKKLGEESLHLRREIGDRVGIAWSLGPMALNHARIGHFAEAEQLWRERIALGYEVGALQLVALSYAQLGIHYYFIQGDFVQVRANTEEALKIVTTMGYADAAGWALTTLGLLASMDEQYQEGKAYCLQAASSAPLTYIADFAAWGFSIADCGLGDYEAARQWMPPSLKYNVKVRGLVGILLCLPPAAILIAQQGDKVQAVEWLALAFTHPVKASGWMEKWPLLTRLRADLENDLGTEAYIAAWERGKLLDVEKVSAALQEQFGQGDVIPQKKVNQALIERLTERELEVLRLLTDGLANQEIADRLILAPGTVKWYTTQIYGKLGVRNRIQAVRRAQELNLFS